jgi:hypothetical protein
MTTLQVYGLMLFMFFYVFVERAVAWSRQRSRNERSVLALATVALGVSVAGFVFLFLSELAAPSSVMEVPAWVVWLFAGCDVAIPVLLGVRAIWWLKRAGRRV